MAILLDQSTLGTFNTDTALGTIPLTTTATVAAGATIVVAVGWFDATDTLVSVADTGLNTYTVDDQLQGGSDHCGIASAYCSAGLASGATITATMSGSVAARSLTGSSFTGVASSSRVDDTNTDTGVTTNAWTTGNIVTTMGAVIYAQSVADVCFSGSTITAPSIETSDFRDVNDDARTTGYRIETAASTYTVAGTWGGAAVDRIVTVGVAYRAAVTATPGAGDNPPIGILGRGAGW